MKIAVVSSPERGETDRLLTTAAEQLRADGVALAGIVKELDYEAGFENGCDMKVRVLPGGPVIKITQSLGKGSDACRLDPGAIANAVSTVENSALEQADLFILNKFGPEEASGRGFCNVIGAALERGIPVLGGGGPGAREAFDTFVDGLAVTLPPDGDAIREWCRDAISSPT
jgi:glycosyltransferase involved in cell wall biosynthesis